MILTDNGREFKNKLLRELMTDEVMSCADKAHAALPSA